MTPKMRIIPFCPIPNPRELTSDCCPDSVPNAWDFCLIRLGFLSHTLGISVPYAWDFCPIRLGFLSQTLGNRWDDSFMRMVRAMLCRSFTFIGHIAHLKKTVKDGKDSKNPNFFRKYRNRNSPIHIFVFFEKVLKTTVLSVFTVCNPTHSTF